MLSQSDVQTMSCRTPPAWMTIGELLVAVSSSAFHASLPVSVSNAITVASGFAPTKTISRSPSINGEAWHLSSAPGYSFLRSFCQTTSPFAALKQ